MAVDDLRTRIADAIYNASDEYTRKLMVRPGLPGASEVEGIAKPVCYALADAVIRELGNLRLQPHGCGRDDCHRHRVISDWTGNDGDWTADE